MKLITTSAELKIAIQQLELQQANELILLKEEFDRTKEGLKPINILKGTFKDAIDMPDLKTGILNAAIGLTTGILAKKILIGKTLNPFSKLLGVVLEGFVAGKVSNNAGEIKSIGSSIISRIFNRRKKAESI